MFKKLVFSVFLMSFIMFLGFQAVLADGNNLIQNPSFELESGGMPTAWISGAYVNSTSVTEFKLESGHARTGSKFASIINKSQNDARFKQEVNVREDSMYKLSCWIKTENVGSGQSQKGANISVEGKLETSKDIKGTNNDWEYVEMYAKTGKGIKTIKVTVGIGGYGAMNTGKASFDDIAVEEVTGIPKGAVVVLMSDSQQSRQPAPAQPKSSTGSPSKILWFLLILAVVAIAAGVYRYFKYVNEAPHENTSDTAAQNDGLDMGKVEKNNEDDLI